MSFVPTTDIANLFESYFEKSGEHGSHKFMYIEADTQEEANGSAIMNIIHSKFPIIDDLKHQDDIVAFIDEAVMFPISDVDRLFIYIMIIEEIIQNKNVHPEWRHVLQCISSMKDFKLWSVANAEIPEQCEMLKQGGHRIPGKSARFLCKMDKPNQYNVNQYLLSCIPGYGLSRDIVLTGHPLITQHLVYNVVLTGDREQLKKLPDNVKIVSEKFAYILGCLVEFDTKYDIPDNYLQFTEGYCYWYYGGLQIICLERNRFSMIEVMSEIDLQMTFL